MEQEEAVDNPGSKSDEHNEKQSKGSLQKKINCVEIFHTSFTKSMFRKNYKDHIKSVHPGKDINNFLLPQDTTRINKELLLPAVSSLSQEMEEAGKMMTRPTKLPRIVLLSPDMQRIK